MNLFPPERRAAVRELRMQRLGFGAGIGAPAAAVVAWGLSLKGVHMPPGVEAAMGALIGVVVVCIHDTLKAVAMFAGQIIRKVLGL